MKKQSIFYVITSMALLVCACSEEANVQESQSVKGINVVLTPFADDETSTRTAYTVSETEGFLSSWTEGDVIGIYPVGGDQVAFPISDGAGTSSAKFDGGAWALRSNYKYAAYYPFSDKNYTVSEATIPVDYTNQTQRGNNSTAHLGAYDFLASAATQPDAEGNVNLEMKHLGCFVRFRLHVDRVTTFTKMTVTPTGTGVLFTSKGTINLKNETPSITSSSMSSTFTLLLDNITNTPEEKILTLYAMIPPVSDFLDKQFVATVIDINGLQHQFTGYGKNFVAGKSYDFNLTSCYGTGADQGTGTYNSHEYVDLGLPSGTLWATTNVGANAPEEDGEYFAWGETSSKESKTYTYDNYKYWIQDWTYNGNKAYTINKYCILTDDGKDNRWEFRCSSIDNKTVLDRSDDAASVAWGGKWRMPTMEEHEELMANCTTEFITSNGVKVVKVTSKSNSRYILLPLCGMEYNTRGIDGYGSQGYYWSSSLHDWSIGAYCSRVDKLGDYTSINPDAWMRCYGCAVRPVFKQ